MSTTPRWPLSIHAAAAIWTCYVGMLFYMLWDHRGSVLLLVIALGGPPFLVGRTSARRSHDEE